MTVNPLVAASLDGGPDAWSGIWIAEDIEAVHQGIENGSWIDGTLGVVGTGLDALALISDPVGALLQYGVAWIIEHVKPLSEALDWLAGDPARIAGHAQTWRNVASDLRHDADTLVRDARLDLSEWAGGAADAYRKWAGEQRQSIEALARAADTMAAITEGAGFLIAAVRVLVRDAIATLVSRLIVYAVEEVASLGVAGALIVEQVSTLVASWAGKITQWLRGLLVSLRALVAKSERLERLIVQLSRRSRPIVTNIDDPKKFDPEELRGLSAAQVRRSIPSDWVRTQSAKGGGEVFADPSNRGRQIRLMPGYPRGSRADPVTWGPYAVVSQAGRKPTKIPLRGNPQL